MSLFEFKMSEEINQSVVWLIFDQLNHCDNTSSVKDILAFARALDEKYAEQRVN